MQVEVNATRCTGHGRCYSLAPDVFEDDPDGYGSALYTEVPPDLHDQARLGGQNCPEQAITLTE